MRSACVLMADSSFDADPSIEILLDSLNVWTIELKQIFRKFHSGCRPVEGVSFSGDENSNTVPLNASAEIGNFIGLATFWPLLMRLR